MDIYEDTKAKHVCDDFGVALACDGESDFIIC
jgi:hypothetical protein